MGIQRSHVLRAAANGLTEETTVSSKWDLPWDRSTAFAGIHMSTTIDYDLVLGGYHFVYTMRMPPQASLPPSISCNFPNGKNYITAFIIERYDTSFEKFSRAGML